MAPGTMMRGDAPANVGVTVQRHDALERGRPGPFRPLP